MTTRRVNLLLVDDHRVVRLGLKALFETVPHFTVVGEAGAAAEAVAQARELHPDVVIMDVRLGDGSGIEACREIRSEHPETRVFMLTSYSDEDAIVASIMAGAAGYILKQIEPERLIEAVEMVADGKSLLDPGVTDSVLGWMRRIAAQGANDPNDPLGGLSDQERHILPLIAEGKTNREIAGALNLSEYTVKTYVSNILQKLHMTRRSEAAAFIARRRSSRLE
jgi:DNA-binding NarL/FixJ family response regulator